MRRSRVLPFLPPLLLVAVALVQLGLAHTTSLSPWKMGGFGMFSTSDSPGFRVHRVKLETDAGIYIVPGPVGSEWTRVWPRASVLRADARKQVCTAWQLIPLDSSATAAVPEALWAEFYSGASVLRQTDVEGFAIPASRQDLVSDSLTVRAARSSVWWIRMGPSEGDRRSVVPQLVATETVTADEAGCS